MQTLHERPRITPPSARITSMPILMLNAHSRCNCRCVMCDIWKRENNDQIHAEDMERHRASLQNLGVQHVVLTGGEPLLHNDLAALCNFFRSLNIRITLLTTGLLLLKRAQEVATLFDDAIISIDGPQQVHDAIRRVNGAYHLIQRGIVEVREHKPSFPITCRSTIQKANHNHLRATVRSAKELHLDSISFLAADLTSEAFNRLLIWPGERQSEIGLNLEQTMALEYELDLLITEHQTDIQSGYVLESASKLRCIARRFREHLGEVEAKSPICNAPWVSTVVEVDGSVRPCFFHRTIGNINSASFEDVVNGTEAQTFRKNLDIENDPTCRRCVCSLNYRRRDDAEMHP